MSPQLTDDQRHALAAHKGAPVYVIDSERNTEYVILPAKEYRRVRQLLEEEAFSIRETYPFQNQVAAACGWEDTGMTNYDRFPSRPSA